MSKLKMNFVMALVAAVIWTGCQSTPKSHSVQPDLDNRKPSQVAHDRYSVQGRVGMSVSKVDAGFDSDVAFGEDAFYIIQVDCDLNRKLTRREQNLVIKVSAKSTSKKQQRVFAAYKKRSERQNKTGGALPYLQVRLTTENPNDLCEDSGAGRVAYGTNPEFYYVK